MTSNYKFGLGKNAANYIPLSPLTFLRRSANVYPNKQSVVYGNLSYTYNQTYARARRLASSLTINNIGKNDTVTMLAGNIPALYEAHFGVPMAGAVLNAINTRLDATTIAFILEHSNSKLVITDTAFSSVMKKALKLCKSKPLVIDINDVSYPDGERLGIDEYENFLSNGDPEFKWNLPDNEWDAISLNYTSGTTGNPKGVIYHHRGAYLLALGNVMAWEMSMHPKYLWTLPMFHCNGWCFPWTLAAQAGASICLRKIEAKEIYHAIHEKDVTNFCGAPVILNMLVNTPKGNRRPILRQVEVMTAAAPPPPIVLQKMEAIGFKITHVYGLTESYGPAVMSAWKNEWNKLPDKERAFKKARQGVPYHVLDDLMVADPLTMDPVPKNGKTMGEVMMRGNIMMKGYLNNQPASEEAFADGWFHTGDLAIWHPDGYISLKDRSKDVIISGGENISTIEVEDTLYMHPSILEAAVVAKPDEYWGEIPCAFVLLKDGEKTSEIDIIEFCRGNLARYKVPKHVVFGKLPKTSTGKVQKFILRKHAQEL